MNKIPVLDCSGISDNHGTDSGAFQDFAKQFGSTLGGIGFAYLKNHCVDLDLIAKMYKISKEFFELPMHVKNKYHKVDVKKSYHGYFGPGEETLNRQKSSTELRELFDVYGPEGLDSSNFPVQEIPEFKTVFDEYKRQCNQLTIKLLQSLSIYLGLEDPNFFVERHSHLNNDLNIKTQSLIRMMYYGPLESNSVSKDLIRCGEHTDWGTITLLFQDNIGGLEVKTIEGNWIKATPIEGTIVVNSGDLLEFWTAGRLPATPHRVRIMTDDTGVNPRQSIICAVNPDANAWVQPLFTTHRASPHHKENIENDVHRDKAATEGVNAFEYLQRKREAIVNYRI